MNVTQCPNGHYYDSDRFGSTCPQCTAGTNSTGDATMALHPEAVPAMPYQSDAFSDGYDQTVPLNPSMGYATGIDPTVPVQSTNAGSTVMTPYEQAKTEQENRNTEKIDDEKTVGISLWNLGETKEEDTVKVECDVEPVVGWLICVKGNNLGRDYRLTAGRNFVGRSQEMDVCIKGDNTVSRNAHAIVVYDPKSNSFLAQPGDAKELFYINGELVLMATKLSAFDKISLGETELMFIPLCGEEFNWSSVVNK